MDMIPVKFALLVSKSNYNFTTQISPKPTPEPSFPDRGRWWPFPPILPPISPRAHRWPAILVDVIVLPHPPGPDNHWWASMLESPPSELREDRLVHGHSATSTRCPLTDGTSIIIEGGVESACSIQVYMTHGSLLSDLIGFLIPNHGLSRALVRRCVDFMCWVGQSWRASGPLQHRPCKSLLG